MSTPLRIGVVGAGFGEFHVRTLINQDGADLVAVADHSEERSALIGSRYGCASYNDAERMMDSEELDAISVCVSPRGRAPILKSAVDRGLSMFVEKPWATDGEHAAELASICAGATGTVMTAFSFRFHPAIRKAIDLVQGDLGPIRVGTGCYVFDWLPPADSWLWDPQNGGGIFNENSCHLFDVVCALAGRPIELLAYGVHDGDRPSETAAVVTLRFESGGTVGLSLGGLGSGANTHYPWFEGFTENGWFKASGANHVWQSVSWANRGAGETNQFEHQPEQLGRTRYSDAFDHFIQCVQSGTSPEAGIDAGVLMVHVADAVRESLRSGKPQQIAAP